MPPAAISRSSTYLPKIWGNTARAHGSALGLALLLLGCSEAPEGRVLPIRALRPPGCGPAAPATIQLEALGDFDASPFTSETIISQSESGTALSFPPETRAVEARAEGGGTRFIGLGERRANDAIELLILPEDDACELYRPSATRPYPLAIGGQAIGFSPKHRRLLVAGSLAPSGDSARALSLDVDTLEASDVPSGMIPGRAFATLTTFGEDGMLVAGGVDPTETSQPEVSSAIVYDVIGNRFERSALIQSKARARHAAVVLADGDTLLVGGIVDEDVSGSLERISPIDRAASIPGAALARPRREPTALVLDDGRVFVGGGDDASGQPVPSLEWLSPDANTHLFELSVEVAPGAVFAAMPGGGVLAVGVCAETPCAGALAAQVAWIRANFLVNQLPPLGFDPADPALVAGAAGSPLLVATRPNGVREVLRFDPWSGRFVAPEVAPPPPPAGAEPLAIEPGLFVWLEPFGDALGVRAFRHDLRGVWSRDVAPLILTGTTHLAPDRLPNGEISFAGTLTLTAADPPARVFVTDTTYEELRLEIGFTSDAPPVVALNDALFGGADCPWPEATTPLTLTRRRTEVTLEAGSSRQRCSIVSGRVKIALLPLPGATKSVVVESLRIARSAD